MVRAAGLCPFIFLFLLIKPTIQMAEDKKEIVREFDPDEMDVLKNLKIGFYAEEVEAVAIQEGYLYIPYIYEVPNFEKTFLEAWKDPCLASAMISAEKIIVSWRERWRKLIPEREGNPLLPILNHSGNNKNQSPPGNIRKKRFLGLVLGGLNALGNVWNAINVNSLRRSIDVLRSDHLAQWESIRENRQALNSLGNEMHKAGVYMRDLGLLLNTVIDRVACLERSTMFMDQYLAQYNMLGPLAFSRVLEATLAGKISPELLPNTKWGYLIHEIKDLQFTIYTATPSLIYQLGQFFLDQISREPMRLTGVLVIPKIFPHRVGPLLSVSTVPYTLSEDLYSKLIIPQHAAITATERIAWIPSFSDCIRTPGMLVCSESVMMKNIDLCLTNLIFNGNQTSCLSKVIKGHPNDMPVPIKTGVLIGSHIKEVTLSKLMGGRIVSSSRTLPSEPVVLTSQDGDFLIYMSRHFSLTTHSEVYQENVLPILNVSLNPESIKQVETYNPVEWTDLSIANVTPSWVISPNEKPGFWVIIILVLISIGIIAFLSWRLMRKVNKRRRLTQQLELNTSPVISLMPRIRSNH